MAKFLSVHGFEHNEKTIYTMREGQETPALDFAFLLIAGR